MVTSPLIGLPSIPVEIWHRILSWLTIEASKETQSKLAALLSSSSYLRDIVVPFLYRNPQIYHIIHWSAFIRTIARNPCLGSHVKALELGRNPLFIKSFKYTFPQISSNGLANSVHFSISIPFPIRFTSLDQTSQSDDFTPAEIQQLEMMDDTIHRLQQLEFQVPRRNADAHVLPDLPQTESHLGHTSLFVFPSLRTLSLLLLQDVGHYDALMQEPNHILQQSSLTNEGLGGVGLLYRFWTLLQVYCSHGYPQLHPEQITRDASRLHRQDLVKLVMWLENHFHHCMSCSQLQLEPKSGSASMMHLPTSSLIDALECMPNLTYLSLSNIHLTGDAYVVEMQDYTSRISVPVPSDFSLLPISSSDVLLAAFETTSMTVLDLSGCKWVQQEHIQLILEYGSRLVGLNLLSCSQLPSLLNRMFFFENPINFRHELKVALELCS